MPTLIFKLPCQCQADMTLKIIDIEYKKNKIQPIKCRFCGLNQVVNLAGKDYKIIA